MSNHSMCVTGTPIELYPDIGLWVKREDLCCPEGPHFSKTRGVYAHIAKRPEQVIGVLDTGHSQGGWAVAQACQKLGKECILYYPVYKCPRPLPAQQEHARALGAQLRPLQAGRSAVLYHSACRDLSGIADSYMMPNALKLPEMVEETALEVLRTLDQRTLDQRKLERWLPLIPPAILISASSGTIAAGVIKGLRSRGVQAQVIVHMGYSRSNASVLKYMTQMSGLPDLGSVTIVDEGYAYKDEARPGPVPPFPCNTHYDLKAFRWWMKIGHHHYRDVLMWNIG